MEELFIIHCSKTKCSIETRKIEKIDSSKLVKYNFFTNEKTPIDRYSFKGFPFHVDILRGEKSGVFHCYNSNNKNFWEWSFYGFLDFEDAKKQFVELLKEKFDKNIEFDKIQILDEYTK